MSTTPFIGDTNVGQHLGILAGSRVFIGRVDRIDLHGVYLRTQTHEHRINHASIAVVTVALDTATDDEVQQSIRELLDHAKADAERLVA